jgi:hypothetical protein
MHGLRRHGVQSKPCDVKLCTHGSVQRKLHGGLHGGVWLLLLLLLLLMLLLLLHGSVQRKMHGMRHGVRHGVFVLLNGLLLLLLHVQFNERGSVPYRTRSIPSAAEGY